MRLAERLCLDCTFWWTDGYFCREVQLSPFSILLPSIQFIK